MAVGRLSQGERSALLFGLPGNPVAVMVTFAAFVRPALQQLMGWQTPPQPLLKARCVRCHGPNDPEGGLDLSRAAAILRGGESGPPVAATADESLLWQRVSAGEMPPDRPLPPAEQAAYAARDKAHCEKPVALMETFISVSTDPGALVVDPYSGSGASVVAAQNLGRYGIGFEIDDAFDAPAPSREPLQFTAGAVPAAASNPAPIVEAAAPAFNPVGELVAGAQPLVVGGQVGQHALGVRAAIHGDQDLHRALLGSGDRMRSVSHAGTATGIRGLHMLTPVRR